MPIESPQIQERSSTKSRVGVWIAVVLIGMAVLQATARLGTAGRQTPGPARGDLTLDENSLPTDLAGWKRTAFTPAPPPEELPKGQFWWVHQWQYKLNETMALVSLDQLGEKDWHELTYCYTGFGWNIEARDVLQDSEHGGTYAVARMKMESGELAILVFSVFFEDGQWATAPVVDLPRLNARGDDYLSRIGDRVIPIISYAPPDSSHNRALQCQVFVPGLPEITPELIAATVRLHRESRVRFRSAWLSHTRPTTSNK